jgi:hypothetical protein
LNRTLQFINVRATIGGDGCSKIFRNSDPEPAGSTIPPVLF